MRQRGFSDWGIQSIQTGPFASLANPVLVIQWKSHSTCPSVPRPNDVLIEMTKSIGNLEKCHRNHQFPYCVTVSGEVCINWLCIKRSLICFFIKVCQCRATCSYYNSIMLDLPLIWHWPIFVNRITLKCVERFEIIPSDTANNATDSPFLSHEWADPDGNSWTWNLPELKNGLAYVSSGPWYKSHNLRVRYFVLAL